MMTTNASSNRISVSMTRTQIIFLIITLAVGASGLAVAVLDHDAYKLQVQKELSYAEQTLGQQQWQKMQEVVNDRYKRHFKLSGHYDTLHAMFIPAHDEPARFKTITRILGKDLNGDRTLDNFVNNIQVLVYQVTFRLTALEYWLSLLTPLLVCILISAINEWRIKQYQVGGASTTRARIYIKVTWLVVIGAIFLTITPNMLGKVSVVMPAIVLLTITLIAGQFIKSYQKDAS
ncbi:MAG: DUF4400 domain-containing protein [Alteromonadaceae bacterium]|nr:DUF4400 domain-containing protein [Alteromonadaceae bacterium]